MNTCSTGSGGLTGAYGEAQDRVGGRASGPLDMVDSAVGA